MRKAGHAAAAALDHITPKVKPGVSTEAIDDAVRHFMFAQGGVPATLGYRGYTKSSCTSINHVICHGIPGPKPLKDGDIVNIDVTILLDGWHGDTSRMFIVGEPRRKAERLIEVTYEAMMAGIAEVKPGATLGDVGAAIQEIAETNRCSVVQDFCGHGIGRLFPRQPERAALWPPRRRRRAEAGHVLHHRAHAQSRATRCQSAERWLDSSDAGQIPVGAV